MEKGMRIAVIALLMSVLLSAQTPRSADAHLKAAQHKEEVEGDLKGAIEDYAKIAQGSDRAIAARALIRMAECYQKLGQSESRAVYERIVREFADQKDSVTLARTRLGEESARAYRGVYLVSACPRMASVARCPLMRASTTFDHSPWIQISDVPGGLANA